MEAVLRLPVAIALLVQPKGRMVEMAIPLVGIAITLVMSVLVLPFTIMGLVCIATVSLLFLPPLVLLWVAAMVTDGHPPSFLVNAIGSWKMF